MKLEGATTSSRLQTPAQNRNADLDTSLGSAASTNRRDIARSLVTGHQSSAEKKPDRITPEEMHRLHDIITGTAETTGKNRSQAIERLRSQLPDTADRLIEYTLSPNLPLEIREETMAALVWNNREANQHDAKLLALAVSILNRPESPVALRESMLNLLKPPQSLSETIKQQLTYVALEPIPSGLTGAHLAQEIKIRSELLELVGSHTVPAALAIVRDPKQPAALRAAAAETLALYAEPKDTPELLKALQAAVEAGSAKSIGPLSRIIAQSDPERFVENTGRLLSNSPYEKTALVMAASLLSYAPHAAFDQAFDYIVSSPSIGAAHKLQALKVVADRLGTEQIDTLYARALDALASGNQVKPGALPLAETLAILQVVDREKAKDLSTLTLSVAKAQGHTDGTMDGAIRRAEAIVEHAEKQPATTPRSSTKASVTDLLNTITKTDLPPEQLQERVVELRAALRSEANQTKVTYALSVLREKMKLENDPLVMLNMAAVLSEHGDKQALQVLSDTTMPPWWRANAADLLITLKNPGAIQALYELLNDDDRLVAHIARTSVAALFSRIGPDKAIARFEAALSSPEVPLESKAALQSYVENLRQSIDIGIDHPYRFAPKTLASLVDGRMQDTIQDRYPGREVLVVMPKEDETHAFIGMNSSIQDLIDKGYTVRLFECETDVELRNVLAQRGAAGKAADVVVLAGHGSRTSLSLGTSDPALGPADPDPRQLDVADVGEFTEAGVHKALRKHGTVILVSCSNGKGRGAAENLANAVEDIFYESAPSKVLAAQHPFYPRGFEFDSEGDVSGFVFSGESYDAASDE